jgi:hypothetical protein
VGDWPRDVESVEQSEFGLGSGMIDPGERADRSLPVHQELWEIKSRPKTYAGSEAGLPGGERPALEDTPVPRLAPGETEADRQ